MNSTKYFFTPANGLKADIERHRKQEQELLSLLETLEQEVKEHPENRLAQSRLRACQHFLNLLRQSKAETVASLGRKK